MESPTHGSTHIAKSYKKRVFPGGNSSQSGFNDIEILETAPSSKIISKPTSSQKKKVVCEIIDLDLEEDSSDVLVIDGKADSKGKHKKTSSNNGSRSMPSNIDPEILRNFELFKKFDTVEDCSDNYFFAKEKSSSKQPPKNWAKRIQEEWKILENNLPDTIFVRVSESRMDLLRAVIVGAEGTPYHDGLFFFDICFPASYPNSPPEVHYHSGGLPINPNLYENGTVCLSLLNTWRGQSKNEEWLPKVSTMLQVLVSIQGLILNAKPYFNEPGYERMMGTGTGEYDSLQYNENTFIYSLKTMAYSMNRPPKYFEALVVGHFCMVARDILVSCKAYLEGVQVGCLVRGGVQDVDEGNKSCSENFKRRLAGFITTLVETFTRIGAKGCEEFHSLAQKTNGLPALKPRTRNKG